MLHVLLAEDNPGDVWLVGKALKTAELEFELMVMPDGEQMLSYIALLDQEKARCPDVVLLDLNLPKWGGDTLLRRLRASERCKDVPVIVVTSSDLKSDRDAAAELGANDYFRKANDFDEFMQLGSVVKRHITNRIQ